MIGNPGNVPSSHPAGPGPGDAVSARGKAAPRRKTTRIAIAGLGAAARQIHLPAYARLPDVEVVGGCDPAVRDADFAFPLFPSLEQMIEQARPDLIAVVTPTAHHFPITRASLLAGCHVLCEKPFMPTLDEADEICALAESVGRWVVVNNQYRFMNIHAAAKELIGGPEFGDLLFISAEQTFHVSEHTESGWRGQDPQRTCKEFGIHVLDLCRFMFGTEPLAITARMPKGDQPAGPDLLNLILLEFPGDRVAHILLDRFSRGRHRYLKLRLDGTAGCIEARIGGRIQLSAGIRGGTRKPFFEFDMAMGGAARLYHGERYRHVAKDPLDLFASATSRLVRAFLDALNEGTVPPCNARDNRRTLALMLAAYESQRTCATVAVGP